MNDVWIKVERGIRYREHPTRKHGVPRRADRYYVIRIAVDNVMRQEALGWESEGITLDKARLELAKLREAKRTGKGPRSLTEKRELAETKRKADEEARRTEEAARITVSQFWQNNYRPAQVHKAHGSLVAEHALWTKWLQPRIFSSATARNLITRRIHHEFLKRIVSVCDQEQCAA